MPADPNLIFRRIVLVCLIVIGLVAGTFAAVFVHRGGQNLFAALFAGMVGGIGAMGSAFMFLLAVLRIIWLVRFVRHVRRTKN